MKAIQTNYRGIRYRSRTEARWAVFFDELRLPYDYEPEGFDLGGDLYLPDFWLPTPGVWFEVKGVAPDEREKRVAAALSKASRCPVIIGIGAPPISEQHTLLVFSSGQMVTTAAFTGDKTNLFISDEWQSFSLTIRGSPANISGAPQPITDASRVAAAERFGVHD